MRKPPTEFQAFTAVTDRLLRVPKATVDARLAAYNAERATAALVGLTVSRVGQLRVDGVKHLRRQMGLGA